jgi:hypothetical protein
VTPERNAEIARALRTAAERCHEVRERMVAAGAAGADFYLDRALSLKARADLLDPPKDEGR